MRVDSYTYRVWYVIMVVGVIFLLLPGSALAARPDSAWTWVYGGSQSDIAEDVQPTFDGGYIIVGFTESVGAGGADVLLVKMDADGDTVWTRTYGGSSDDAGLSVLEVSSGGGYMVAGKTRSFGSGGDDVYVLRVDLNGDTLWTKTYGGSSDDIGNCLQRTSDGGYVIAGNTYSFGAGDTDVYLIRIDSNGDTLWTGAYGTTTAERGHSVDETSDDGYIICGTRRDPVGPAGSDAYIVRVSAIGESLWTQTYGVGDVNEYLFEIREISPGVYMAAGEHQEYALPGEAWLVKLDAEGDTVWTKWHSPAYFWDCAAAYSMDLTDDGGYVLAGYAGNCEFMQERFYIVKTDASGDTMWTSSYGGWESDQAFSVRQSYDGGYIIFGGTLSYGSGSTDLYGVKLECDLAGVDRDESSSGYALSVKSLPNPSVAEAMIEYQVPSPGEVDITIYNLLGREVRTLVMGVEDPGKHSVTWDGLRSDGSPAPPGVYFCRFEAGGQVANQKVVLLK